MQFNTITVFGGSGFLGRHVIRRLVRMGAQVRVAVRDPVRAEYLKPMGEVGQVVLLQANVRNMSSIHRAIADSDAVINLTGLLHQTGDQTFQAIHVDAAKRIADACLQLHVKRFIHISAIGADRYGDANYARTKSAGETAARDKYPNLTIVRPSIVFGPEDNFFNLFAWLATISPFLPLPGKGQTRFQPVYVGDVADGIGKILEEKNSIGQIYEFGGPQVLSFKELMEIILESTGRKRLLLPIPLNIMKFSAIFFSLLPRPLLTRDQVEMLKANNIVSENALGLSDLNISATPIEAVVNTYLHRYRRHGRLAI